MKIDKLNKNDRPRERLILNGPNNLTDVELLAIMLGSGSKKESVLELSARLINEYGFKRLFQMSYEELNKISGIKEAKATKLMAAFEISRRCVKEDVLKKTTIYNAKELYKFIVSDYYLIDYEMISVVYVNNSLEVIKKRMFSNEVPAQVLIPTRKIVAEAISLNAFGVFLAHNHPSNNITPSMSDIDTTIELSRVLANIQIKLLDHIIIGKDDYYSFEESDIKI